MAGVTEEPNIHLFHGDLNLNMANRYHIGQQRSRVLGGHSVHGHTQTHTFVPTEDTPSLSPQLLYLRQARLSLLGKEPGSKCAEVNCATGQPVKTVGRELMGLVHLPRSRGHQQVRGTQPWLRSWSQSPGGHPHGQQCSLGPCQQEPGKVPFQASAYPAVRQAGLPVGLRVLGAWESCCCQWAPTGSG